MGIICPLVGIGLTDLPDPPLPASLYYIKWGNSLNFCDLKNVSFRLVYWLRKYGIQDCKPEKKTILTRPKPDFSGSGFSPFYFSNFCYYTYFFFPRGHISRFQPKPGRRVDRLLPHDARVHQLVQQQRPQVAHQGDPGIGTRDRPIWQAGKIGRWTAGPLYTWNYWQRRLQR